MADKRLQLFNISRMQKLLLHWYHANKRDLPWRENQDPYRIWISEIMLQQTKVDTVIPYFHRFLTAFPTVFDLAAGDEQEVLKAWEGLGYYSRARNLQNAAQEVVEKYNGVIPDEPDKLGKLKGIGPYTRGAILSIAFNQPEPAVDGNVMRVVSRLLLIEDDIAQARVKKDFEKHVRTLISKEDPASFNQAVMELGALICTPKSPACLLCPVNEVCRAFAEGVQAELPVKSKAKKQRVVPLMALLIKNDQNEFLIEKRSEKGLLANLWQFPMVPLDEMDKKHAATWLQSEYGVNVQIGEELGELRHVFTHLIWELDIYAAKTEAKELADERIRFVSLDELDDYPFPVSHQKMIPYLSQCSRS